MAVKAISDESDFAIPAMDRFIDERGQFTTGRLAVFSVLRPWIWPRVIELARNSAKASRALCAELERYIQEPEKSGASGPELHPITKVVS
jgi:adenosylhomocysteine nucleosidase